MKIIVIVWTTFMTLQIYGQGATNKDCFGATPVCANVYEENIVPQDEGMFPNEINTAINCGGSPEIKAIWYSFTVNKSGDFGFLITPKNSDADYDWTLFNLTNSSCSDIRSDRSLVVSCNAAGGPGCDGKTGATGDTNFSVQGGNCQFTPPDLQFGYSPFNDLIPVQAGNTYVLYVSNWNKEEGGYQIDFSLSDDLGVFDDQNPAIANVEVQSECLVERLKVSFTENIQCSTISTESVSISGIPNGSYRIFSNLCEQGSNFDKEFTIEFDEPINTAGRYDITISPTPSYPIYDLCDNGFEEYQYSFEVDDMPNPTLLDVKPDNNCQITEVLISFSENILCDGINANSFSVIGPDGAIRPGRTIVPSCTSNSSFTYEFDEPIVTNGEYQLFINSGQGDVLTNECLKPVAGAQTATFMKQLDDSVEIEDFDITGECSFTEITIPLNNAIICTSLTDSHVHIEFNGNLLAGSIIGTNCNGSSPMVFNEIIYELEMPISAGGELRIFIDNGDQSLLTECGVPVIPFSKAISVDLELTSPTITDIVFPDTCNIKNMTLVFSEPVYCHSNNASFFEFQHGNRSIGISDIQLCNEDQTSTSYTLELASVINSDGEYQLNFVNMDSGFTDVCGSPVEEESFSGMLQFNDCDSCFIYIPTAFSPNGDSINEVIEPLSNCIVGSVTMQIYDKWGNLVYESDNNNDTNFWNGLYAGERLNSGIYAYKMDIELMEFRHATKRTRMGTFTIVK